MPYGFVGKASKNYLERVLSALSAAGNVHRKNPFRSGSGPSLPTRNNQQSPHSPSTAASGGFSTGVGNQTNIAVDRTAYYEILQKIHKTDEKAAEELYRVAVQIEEMCADSYVVPRTLPRYLHLLGRVKASLGEFRSMTDDSEIKTRKFTEEIIDIG